MRTLSAPVLAALAGGHAVLVQLVKMDFTSGTVALNTSTWTLVYDGVTYLGAYGLGTISAIVDRPGELQGLRLEMAAGDAARISLALDASDEVQGTVLTIRTAIIDSSSYTILDAPVDWLGTIDTMTIAEDGDKAVISATAESKAVDMLRGNPLTYSDADQQTLYSGDLAFEYVVEQADKPVIWPSREFYFK